MIAFASISGGYGLVTNNQTGQQTYMKMGKIGIGVGAGIKDFRTIFIFHNSASLKRLINYGWIAGLSSDAIAKASDKGGALAGSLAADNITIYQLTESGLSMQVTLTGAKYWKNDALN
jgi:lipid-binding SYLF domain-containing protein